MTGAAEAPRSFVILAYGEEEWLGDCLHGLAAARREGDEVVVVDNGCTRGDLTKLVADAGARLEVPARNLGYAGGCNAGASASTGDVLIFVNSDAIVEEGCIDRLCAALEPVDVGVACAKIVLAEEPQRVNSIGNPVHVSGLSWAGGFGEAASAYPSTRSVTSATGCVFAVERTLWERLGGFWEVLFAYLEDTELSLRCRLLGLDVVCVGEAVARHHYEFSRNQLKMYLLERNRVLVLGTLLERGTLLRLAPVLLLFELLMLPLSITQGWWRQKLRGWAWLARNGRLLRERRRVVQSTRLVGDERIVPLLHRRLEPANVSRPPGMSLVDAIVIGWCRLVLGRVDR